MRDVVDRLVLVPRSCERTGGRLERDRVRILGDFGLEPSSGHGPDGICPRQGDRRQWRVVREERDVGCRVDVPEVFDLDTDHSLSRGVDAHTKHRS